MTGEGKEKLTVQKNVIISKTFFVWRQTIKMARKQWEKQKENPAGCAWEGKQRK